MANPCTVIGMSRTKALDPRQAVTLRIPTSVIAEYQAMGPDWRQRMTAALSTVPVGWATPAQHARVPQLVPMATETIIPHAKPKRIVGYDADHHPIYR